MTSEVLLREVEEADLDVFFGHQQEAEAVYMAAFTAKEPADRAAFTAHWTRIMADERIVIRTIVSAGQVAGHLASFPQAGEMEVTYWIGKAHWGRGIATRALTLFLREMPARPLYARTAKDNVASLRVLQKCGFVVVGEDRGFANARGAEIEELILRLEAEV